MDPRTQKVFSLMTDNLRRDLSLNELARSVNLSPSRLRHMFKADIGVTPSQYLHTLRMQQAKHLLETTFLRGKQIALKVGLGCEVCLVRDFKKAYGLPPMQYRACYLGGLSGKNGLTGLASQICQ
jgi:AraC family transcriptional regulator of arabinose operon